jgi:septum formation protein
MQVVLASASRPRAEILTKAGVSFTAAAANVDESEIRASMQSEKAPAMAAASTLAELKARKVSTRLPQALVIGSDQILECGGAWFGKPADLDEARAQLWALRGRTHRLVNGTCVVLNGTKIWAYGDAPELTMRTPSDAFIEAYLAKMGARALNVVGAYEIEGLGAQLFAKITGDFFSILGLPLLPLLDFLRGHKAMPE